MFERFTEAARGVVVEAEGLAIELGSPTLTPVHLLYGCAEVRDDTAGRPLRDAGLTGAVIRAALPRAGDGRIDPDALRAIGIDYDGIRAATERTFGPGALEGAADRRSPTGRRRVRFTPEAKRSLEQSLRVAVELHSRRIQAGHLLLGVLRADDEDVSRLLQAAGTDVAALSAQVLTQLSDAA
ncbi:MAG TPA: Clp protease N-terminal domain-containing protein [Mycobacteriales bacterium]|nr:Clp protease N-terminal domain-containing protein [Mycobacteriales bacterium]